jgi:lipoprotein-anchoring transpeptidase ErfK/SrfK
MRIPLLLAVAALLAPPAVAGAQQPPVPAPVPPAATPVPIPIPAPPLPPPEPTIAPGVTAGKVAVGGLTVAQAADVITQQGMSKASRRIVVSVAGRRSYLRMTTIRLKLDAERSAKRAYYAGRDKGPNAKVTLALTWRRSTVSNFVARVDKRATIAPRNATVRITVRTMIKKRSRWGRALDEKKLRRMIDRALADPWLTRVLKPGRKNVRPAVGKRDLARRYPTVVTVDKRSFTLRLFKRLKFSKRYGIAVGAAGYDTPPGLYNVQTKQVNPAWTAPNRPWAGAYAGTTIPGGAPNNPLKARWIGVNGAVGIHGTGEPWSIGTRASHGCIRMRVPDVIDLYDRVPIGTPVLIR